MNPTKSISFILGTVLLFSFVSGCAKKPEGKVRIAYLQILVCSPFFVAQENGYFKQEGIEIEPQVFVSSNQIVEALLADKTDAAMSLAQSVAATIEARQPGQLKVFMANAQNDKEYLSSLVVRTDSKISSVEQLKGKKIGCFPGQTAVVYLKMTLEKYGLSPEKDVQIVELEPTVHLQALESGSVDALLSYEPTTTIAIQRNIGRVLLAGAFEKSVINPWVGGVFVFSSKFVREHPELAKKVIAALEKAVDYINANPTEYKKILPKYTPISEDIALRTTNIPYWKLHEIDRQQIQKQTDMLFDKGIRDCSLLS